MPRRSYPKPLPAYRITRKKKYDVLYTDAFPNDAEQVGGCSYEPGQIIIKNGQSDKEAFSTLLHEITHAWSFEFDINLTEKQVLKLEEAIFKFLTLNKFV